MKFFRAVLITIFVAGITGTTMVSAAGDEFLVADIRVEGLDRISEGTVFTYLPIDVGDSFYPARATQLIRSLYRSDFFETIDIGVDGNVLVVKVRERSAISSITFEGNKAIESGDLSEALRGSGIAKGQVYNRSVVEGLERELQDQYLARGKYNAVIATDTQTQQDNRVAIAIDIKEGENAKIKNINIMGNKDFTEEELLKEFATGIPPWWNFFSGKDQYSQVKLQGDLETLDSHYLDRGYLNYALDSSQVTITPNKKDIYVTLNINEGDQFTVRSVDVEGELIFTEEQMLSLVNHHVGKVFSRASVIATIDGVKNILGTRGYAFAEVDIVPDVDEEANEVDLTFTVEPGKRVYVRRVNFHGNYKTHDEVFRREMRQMEGAWYAKPNVDRSKVRIERLPFIEEVEVETTPVPGKDDQVDVEVTVKERLAGNFTATAGYSGDNGFILGLGVQEDNFLGTGNSVAFQFNNSRFNEVYSISYTNPYYTVDGVSRGFSGFYRKTNAGQNFLAEYLADRFGFSVSYGLPLSEYSFARASIGYEHTEITDSIFTPDEITEFLDANGNTYDQFVLNLVYSHDTRNRTVFPDRGMQNVFSLQVAAPGSNLEFWKFTYQNSLFLPLFNSGFIYAFKTDLSYGEAYGDTSDVPFFEKFYLGGISSLRGFETNTLGPAALRGNSTSLNNFDPIGGNLSVKFTNELIFPTPFVSDNKSIRTSFFVDTGQVYEDASAFEFEELRASYGLSMRWLSPVAPLTFSFAKPFNYGPRDRRENFQFNVGVTF